MYSWTVIFETAAGRPGILFPRLDWRKIPKGGGKLAKSLSKSKLLLAKLKAILNFWIQPIPNSTTAFQSRISAFSQISAEEMRLLSGGYKSTKSQYIWVVLRPGVNISKMTHWTKPQPRPQITKKRQNRRQYEVFVRKGMTPRCS